MTTQEQIDDLYARTLALQEAVSKRGTLQNVTDIVDTWNANLTTLTASLNSLQLLANSVSSRCANLAEQLEEHING